MASQSSLQSARVDDAGPIDFPIRSCILWIDVSTGLVERWIEWQCASWQPVFDLQGRWFEYLESQLGGHAQ